MKMRTPLIVLAIVVALQASIVTYLSLGAVQPFLPVLVIIFIGARRGPYMAVITGFFTGLLLDALATGFMGLSSFSLSIVGFLSGKVFYSDVPLPLGIWAAASAVGTLVFSIIFAYLFTLGDAPPFWFVLVRHALPTALYTWALGMLWAISPLYERRSRLRLGG